MKKQDAANILQEISDYVHSIDWKCEKIEDEIPAIRLTFDMRNQENELSAIIPSLSEEDYVIGHMEVPDEVMTYSGMFEIISQVELPLETIEPSDLLLLVNQANATVPLGCFIIKYDFKDKSKSVTDAMLCQKYTFTFSEEEMFSAETICEILLLLLEQKRVMETMIAAILLGKPATEVITAFVNVGR